MDDEQPSQRFNEVVGVIVILGWIGVLMISPLLFMILFVVLVILGLGYVVDKIIN